jgi:small subunit ribosomal protein S17
MIKTTPEKNTSKVQTLKGTVVSTKMKDTSVVLVERYVRHPKYKKYLRRSKRYKVHDPGNTLKDGDLVVIVSCKPISKDKHFKIHKVEKTAITKDN